MRTSKMNDDQPMQRTIKSKAYDKIQTNYQGKPFITNKEFLESRQCPSLKTKAPASSEARQKRIKELAEFESKF